jgi:glycosyltransferase involved in cell wall biosynthesis
MVKKRILLISDVKGWGGWVRGEYIKKYLSDEFHIELMDQKTFQKFEITTNNNLFSMEDVIRFRNNVSKDKDALKFDQFKKYVNKCKISRSFDLYYPLFHTMLIKKCIKRIISQNKKVVSIVTGFPTIKPCFISHNKDSHFKNLSKRCVALFANNIKSLKDLNKEKPEHIPTYYCPRGVDENVFYPMDREPNKKFTVVYVGKPVKEKGLLDYIKPACEMAGARLLINDRNYTNALGPDDMRELYNQADAYVVASIIDGTPNPALEAAACGVPIISNPIGNMPEFIKNGKNGFLIKGRDINKYVNRLRWMMDSPIKRVNMGKEARKTILESWTWEKVLENERKAFREILNG